MPQAPFTMSENSITVFVNFAPCVVHKSHVHFNDLKEYLKKPDHLDSELEVLVSIPKKIEGATFGTVIVGDDGNLYHKGVEVNGNFAAKVIDIMAQGYDVKMWALFLSNLLENPTKSAIDELYLFLEACSLPMTPDGHFLAYKVVKEDYTDCRTGKFDNSVGKIVSMERVDVNANRRETCSSGLHFCSRSYLSSFSGQRLMVVKINPRDVVAIPSDYNNAKGRCCRYEVVGELTSSSSGDTAYTNQGKANEAVIDKIEETVINTDYESPEEAYKEATKEAPEVIRDEPEMYDYLSDDSNEEEITFFHKSTGISFTTAALDSKITEAKSLRGLATELGLPKSTMQDWAARLKKLLKEG